MGIAGGVYLFAVGALFSIAHATVASNPKANPPVHTRLIESEPADGDTLSAIPERIRLVFSGPVQSALSEIRLVSDAGIELQLSSEGERGGANVLLASAPSLTSGTYRLSWRVVSADGHPATGSFDFYVRVEASIAAESAASPDAASAGGEADAPLAAGTKQAGPDQESPAEGQTPTLAAILRGAGLGSLMALAGLLAFISWITPEPTRRTRRIVGFLAVAAAALLTAHVFVWLRSLAHSGPVDASLMGSAMQVGTGRMEALRVVSAVLAVGALGFARKRTALAAVLALTGVALSGAIGHAAATQPLWSIPAKSIHLVAVSFWLGGLLVLVFGEHDPAVFGNNAARVSSVALGAVIAVALTGLLQTLLLVPRPGELIGSAYGTLVFAKVGGLGLLLLFGARHRLRLMPRLAEEGGPAGLRRSVVWETTVMAAVILLAGFLAYIPPPEAGLLAGGLSTSVP